MKREIMNKKLKVKERNKNSIGLIIVAMTVLGLYTLSLVLPLFWALLNSLKGANDFSLEVDGVVNCLFGFPKLNIMDDSDKAWRFDNYVRIFSEMKVQVGSKYVFVPEMMWNSLIYALGSTFVSIASRFVVAYACAKYNFKLKGVIYTFVIVTMILPVVGTLPSEINMTHVLHVYDNYFGILFMKCGFLGMNFLIFYATFKSIPDSFAEAAKIDGAGHFSIMFKIMVPLAMNTIVAVGLLLFIEFWNDYYTPMIYLPSMPTIALGLYKVQYAVGTEISQSVPMKLAACFIVAFPIILIFIAFKNKIIGNISVGGLKG